MSTQPHYLHQTDKSLLTLESVILDFFNWRRDPNRSSRIPEPLWDKVIVLLSHHTKSKVLKKLSISGEQLTQKLKGRGICNAAVQSILSVQTTQQPTQIIAEHPAFIKAMISTPTADNVFDVVLTKQNGTTLQIKKLSRVDMLQLTNTFMG